MRPGARLAFPTLVGYQRRWLREDLPTGVLITSLAIPLSMGMAEVAGVDPVVGLYCGILPLVGYALFGTSRHLVITLDASTAAMVGAAVSPLAGGDAERYAALAAMSAVLAGFVLLAAGLARLGFLADLLSNPVLVGYQAGIAITVIIGQLPRLLAVDADADATLEKLGQVLGRLDDASATTALVGAATLVGFVVLRRIAPRWPGALAVIALATAWAAIGELDRHGVALVGRIPEGLPSFGWPDVSGGDVLDLLPSAAAIALVVAADSIVTSRAFAARSGARIDANRDLLGLGAACLGAGLSKGIPVSSSAARTAVAESAKAHSQMAALAAAATMVVVLVAATPLLRDTPRAALSAVVVGAVARLVDVAAFRRLWLVRRSEFVMAAVTAIGVVAIGILEGVVIAIALSLLGFVRLASRPHDAVLGRAPHRSGWHDVGDDEGVAPHETLMMFRFNGPIFYANAERFEDRVRAATAHDPKPRWCVVDMSGVFDVDATGADVVRRLHADLADDGIVLALAAVRHRVLAELEAYGLTEDIGRDHIFDTLDAAEAAHLESLGTPPMSGQGRPPPVGDDAHSESGEGSASDEPQ